MYGVILRQTCIISSSESSEVRPIEWGLGFSIKVHKNLAVLLSDRKNDGV